MVEVDRADLERDVENKLYSHLTKEHGSRKEGYPDKYFSYFSMKTYTLESLYKTVN